MAQINDTAKVLELNRTHSLLCAVLARESLVDHFVRTTHVRDMTAVVTGVVKALQILNHIVASEFLAMLTRNLPDPTSTDLHVMGGSLHPGRASHIDGAVGFVVDD